MNGQHIREGLINIFVFLRNRWVYHSVFWLVLYIALFNFEDQQYTFSFRFLLEFINVFFYAALVYFNIFYLIPNFLTGNRLWIYIFTFVAACLLITPLKVVSLFFIFSQNQLIQNALIENQRWYFATFLLIGGCSSVYSIISEWKNREKSQLELQNKTIESELRFLKTQINPHFLFNTLNSLYSLTLKKSDDAPEVVLMLSEMMRYMLYECNEPQVLLSKEIAYIENYLNLEKLRLNKKTIVEFEQKGEVSNQKIAPLLFIPFIENCFKHGTSNQIKEAYVYIYMNVFDEKIEFEVKNSKSNALNTLQETKKSGGIGMINVKRRLDLLYPSKNNLIIENNPSEYLAKLTIML